MKKLTLLIAIAFITQATASSQPCLPEGIYFTTQAQIDSFQINYPNCTEIEGNVIFNGEDITNLDSLNVLTSIEGDLNIGWWMYQNPSLISLEGLNNITYVGGSLRIDRNALLIDLTGLDNLTSIGGELRIGTNWAKSKDYFTGNPSLLSLVGLDNLSSIGEGIIIEANNSLTSLASLSSVTSIGGGISISDNASLSLCETASICNYLANPAGDIYINDNAPGCNSPEEVEMACDGDPCPFEKLVFVNQAQIDKFQIFFPDCENIKGDMEIESPDWNSIANLNGFIGIKSIEGSLTILNNDSLITLNGLNSIGTIGGDFKIGSWGKGNTSLRSLSELENLTVVGGALSIDENIKITSLEGLENLIFIGGDLVILRNSSLLNLGGIENLDAGSINNLTIAYNTLLDTCNVLPICQYVASPNGQINIHNNASGCNNYPIVLEICAHGISENSEVFYCEIIPNPFTKSTTIEYELKQASTVQIIICNLLGEQIEVIEKKQSIGKQQYFWTTPGLPAGVYFCVLKTESGMQTMKMIKLKK